LGGAKFLISLDKKESAPQARFFSNFAVKIGLTSPKLTKINPKSAKYNHFQGKARRRRKFFGFPCENHLKSLKWQE